MENIKYDARKKRNFMRVVLSGKKKNLFTVESQKSEFPLFKKIMLTPS